MPDKTEATKPAAKKAATKSSGAKTGASKSADAKKVAAKGNEQVANDVIGLHSLAPSPGSRKPRRRVGRGHGSGWGKTAGRGHNGQGSRSGGKPGPAYEGGQTPVHMRMRKLRGATKKTSMPIGPFRTSTQPVNLEDLEKRFSEGTEVTLEALKGAGLAKAQNVPVKILGRGELKKKLTVHAHKFSAQAREKIEAAGGTCSTIER